MYATLRRMLPGDLVSDEFGLDIRDSYVVVIVDRDFCLTPDSEIRNARGVLGASDMHRIYRPTRIS